MDQAAGRATIVVPCYNEAQRLDCRQFLDFAAETTHRILFVNDGSRDETLTVLRRLKSAQPDVFDICDLPHNMGKAEAVRQGIARALESGTQYVGFWDADLATPLAPIDDFCRVLDRRSDVEMVFGTRMPLRGHRIERKLIRKLLGRVFATVASVVLGTRIYDTQCGAKLFRVSAELRAVFAEPFLARWIFDVEILARLIATRRGTDLPPVGQSIYELPLDHWRDVAGSKLKSGDFVKAIAEMSAIYWRYLRPGLPRHTVSTETAAPAQTAEADSPAAEPSRSHRRAA